MKRTVFALSLLAALTLAGSPAVHAGESTQPGQGLKMNSAGLNGSKLNGFKFNGFRFNGAKFNGARMNGVAFNGPGIILQGRAFNGPGLVVQGLTPNGPGLILQGRNFNGPGLVLQGKFLNGPGIVFQGRTFNGARLNGLELTGFDTDGNELSLVSDAGCAAPQPAREWPLSALTASSVNVRLAQR